MAINNKNKKGSFRLKVKDSMGNVSFLFRNTSGGINYCSSSETPLALSNIAGENACELRFALLDARSSNDAAAAMRKLAAYAREVTVI